MGAAWCKNKTQAAIDKIHQVYPSGANQKTSDKQSNGDATRDTMDTVDGFRPEITSPAVKTPGTWQEVTLEVPEHEPLTRTPVPPPRKKRQLHRKMGMSRPPPPQPPASPPPATNSSQIILKPRPKNLSTVSLPNYNELTPREKQKKVFLSPNGPRKAPSTSSISDATVERVDKYMRKCRSFGSMREQLAEKLSNLDTSSDSDDSWAGLDDWDLGVIEHDTHADNSPPIVPVSKLNKRPERKSTTIPPTIVEDDSIKQESNFASFKPLQRSTSSNEDSWFGKQWTSPQQNGGLPTEGLNGTTSADQQKDDPNISDVKKELQSIIYDFNRAKKISTSSMEVLPTQPIRNIKKKISVTSVTPPPSPEMSDVEDNSENVKVIESMIMNKSGEIDETTHSTLLRLLRESQNIEGALEQLGLQNIVLDNTEIPGVHCYLRKDQIHRNLHTEGRSHAVNVCKSVDSGLDMHSNAEDSQKQDSQSKISLSASSDTLNGSKSIDSGLNDLDEHSSPIKIKNTTVQNETEIATKQIPDLFNDQLSHTETFQNSNLKDSETKVSQKQTEESKHEEQPHEETEGLSSDMLRKPKSSYKEVAESGGSSGRSSMTPSLSELEAALSDMLEKSTEEDDSSLPVTTTNPFKTTSSATSSSSTNPFHDKTHHETKPPTANGSATKLPNGVH